MAGRTSKRTLWVAAGCLGLSLVIFGLVLHRALRPAEPVSLKTAAELAGERRYLAAADVLTALIEREPANTDAFVLRGTCHVRTRQADKARADFEAALRLKAGAPAAELGLAEVLLLEKKPEQALVLARRTADANPLLTEPYAVMAKACYRLFDAAARECVNVFENDRLSPLAAAAAGEVRLGLFASAEEYWKQWHARDPAAAARSRLREDLDEARRQFELTLEHLTVACGKRPERPGRGDADSWLMLAAILLEKGEYEEAARAADGAVGLPGADRVHATVIKAEALSERAARLVQEGVAQESPEKIQRGEAANREAIGLLEDVVRDHPNAEMAREKLAMHYIRAGRFEAADSQARYSIERLRSVKAHYVRGIVHLARGEYESAISELLSVQDKMQNDPRFHFSLGLAYYRRGGSTASSALAATEFRRVVELRPNFVPARLRLARLYQREGWYEEARVQCEEILATPGRPRKLDPQVYLMLSEINRGLNRYDQVLLWLERAAREAPSENALMTQALAMIDQGMEDDVLRQYDPAAEPEGVDKERRALHACIRGYAYLKKNMADKAVQSFQSAVTLMPEFIMGYVHLAHAYESLDRLDDAAVQYSRAIQRVGDQRLPENPALHFGLAMVRIRQDRLGDAEAALRKVVKLDEKNAAARLRLAALELRKRNFLAALGEVDFVIRSCGDTAEARFVAGLIHSACARRPDEEIRAEVTERRRHRPEAAHLAVTEQDIAAERRVHWDHAVENYERAIALDPGFRFSYEVAVIYAVRREFDKMASVYVRAIEVSPPAAKASLLQRLATAYVGSRNLDKAIKAAEESIDLSMRAAKPDAGEVLRGRVTLVNSLIAEGDFIRAEAELNRASGALQGLREAYADLLARLRRPREDKGDEALCELIGRELSLGLLFSRAGPLWLPYAEQAYAKVLTRDPDNVVALQYLGELYMVTQRQEKAEAVNRRILGLFPLSALALRNLAAIEEQRVRAKAAAEATPEKRVEAQAKAIELYEAAIKAAPDFWLAKLELGALYQRAGVHDKAKELYAQVIALNPGQVQALNDYASLCAEEKNDLEKAIEYAKRARALSPLEGAIADTLGVLHTILNQPDAAVEQLEQARYLLPGHPAVLYHLAVAYAKTGGKERALAILEELLKREERFPERDEAEKLRRELAGGAP